MKKPHVLIVALSGLLILGAGAALAEDQYATKTLIEKPDARFGATRLDKAHPTADGMPPTPMPTPVPPEASPMSMSYKEGPVGTGIGAGALAAPRGGAMSTPKQLADREVRKLVRRLG